MEDLNHWHITRVSAEEYQALVPDCGVFFNTPAFTELNRSKVDEVCYLIAYRDQSARFGFVGGRVGDELRMPFSAPYAYPVSIHAEPKQEIMDAALAAFERYCLAEGISNVRFGFPPLFYDEDLLSGWISAMYRADYRAENLDLNFSLDLKKLDLDAEAYGRLLPEKGRKGLRKAMRSNLEIVRCESEADYAEAYEVICIGHQAKGFPVRMSFEQIMDTLRLVGHDAFIVRKDGTAVVAEILYHITPCIVQGIYTGTHPDYMDCNGMNLLTYHTIRYYAARGFAVLDKATAGKDSIPNYGLCNFKESVGCRRSLKFTFRKELKKG